MRNKITILVITLVLGIGAILIGTNLAMGDDTRTNFHLDKMSFFLNGVPVEICTTKMNACLDCLKEKALREKKERCYKKCDEEYGDRWSTLAPERCKSGCDYAIEDKD